MTKTDWTAEEVRTNLCAVERVRNNIHSTYKSLPEEWHDWALEQVAELTCAVDFRNTLTAYANRIEADEVGGGSKTFQREDRYFVIKKSHHNADQLAALERLFDAWKIRTLQCVVVEADWPEHEPVWAMIKARMTNPPAQPAQVDSIERFKAGYRDLLLKGLQLISGSNGSECSSPRAKAAELVELLGVPITEQPAQEQPGWKWVPLHATFEMCEAAHTGPNCGETALDASCRAFWEDCYEAMLAASPTPPKEK